MNSVSLLLSSNTREHSHVTTAADSHSMPGPVSLSKRVLIIMFSMGMLVAVAIPLILIISKGKRE